ncbi:TolC family protein [Pedobacter panaciterrae]|jgi:Outer membrane protein|uniref:TolC family protein n=1 Tax=Pedobacter panaciterrae TaxID=363849 RepID=A0ABU8NRF0_9SPHI|nr:TolC family protein [Pedobacter panaciterrae]NQX54281.1 TolC family protein [Pedobacter panaciterrae]
MNRKTALKSLILLILGCWLPFSVFSQSPLQGYIDEALKNNLGIQKQDFALQRSLYALKEAKGLFLPDVELNTSYLTSGGGRKIEIPIGDLLNPVYSTLNSLTGSGKFPQVDNVSQTFNPNNYYDAKVHTTLPLYNAEIIYNSRIKKEQITMQQIELRLYKRELIKQVKLAYYGYEQSLQAIKIFENGIALAKENLRINQSMVKNGKAIRTVVARSENELTGLETQLENARTESLNAAAYFNFLLNKPLNSTIEISENENTIVGSDSSSHSGKREELTALESLNQINTLSVKLTRVAVLPKLSTFVDVGAQGDFLKVNKDAPYYLFGVTLSWQIFNGNRNKNKTQQALLDLKSTETQTEQASQQLELEVITAQNKLNAALQAFKASVSQSSLSLQYYKDEQRLYKEGQALYLELLDAQTRLINDQLKQSIAYLNMLTRTTELERAKASYIL